MKIELKPSAFKQLQRLPQNEQNKIFRKLHLLQNSPQSGKLLKGELTGIYSLRAWPYRILYQIHRQTLTILVISHRQSAYK